MPDLTTYRWVKNKSNVLKQPVQLSSGFHKGRFLACLHLKGQVQMFYAWGHFSLPCWNNPENMCLFSTHPPHLIFLYGDWQRRTRAVAPWGAPADLSPALIFPLVTPLVLAEVEVLEAWAAVGSVSGPSWQIQGTQSPWFSLSFRWRRSRIIWKWRVLNRQPSGELSCEEWEWLVLVWDDYSVGTLRIYVWQEVCHMVFTRCCRKGFVIFVWWDYISVDAGLVFMSVFEVH